MSKAPQPIGSFVDSFVKRHGLDGKVVGIDPSLTNTAVAVGNGRDWSLKEFSSKPLGDFVVARATRYDGLVERIVQFIESKKPIDAIYIEGYAFSRNPSGQRWLVEFGGILRWHLVDLADRVVEVSPTTLKKFVTGKGNAPKESVLAHIQKRWGELFESNDAGDAFGLYKLGCVVEGIAEGENVAQREAAATVKDEIDEWSR